MVKLVFVDMDDTFVAPDKTIPADNLRILDVAHARPELCRTSSIPVNVEITSVRATKGTALTWLCGHLGISPADAVAFGDSSNDLAMIEAAGDGVAMGNSSLEVKAAADHVAPPCDEAGVARYLEPMLRG